MKNGTRITSNYGFLYIQEPGRGQAFLTESEATQISIDHKIDLSRVKDGHDWVMDDGTDTLEEPWWELEDHIRGL